MNAALKVAWRPERICLPVYRTGLEGMIRSGRSTAGELTAGLTSNASISSAGWGASSEQARSVGVAGSSHEASCSLLRMAGILS